MEGQENIKYTAVLPSKCLDALRGMVRENKIASVNQGIRRAVETYVAEQKKQWYAQEMLKAGKDPEFLARTLETQAAFAAVDSEGLGEW